MRQPRRNQLRKAIRQQLNFIRRNLKHIKALAAYHQLSPLNIGQGLQLETVKELYSQHRYMYEHKTHKKLSRQDELDRIAIEGKFGVGKRRYGLDLIKEKLKETSETTIMINLIVMNLARGYRDLFVIFSKSVISAIRAWFLHFAGRIIPAAA
jgi:hypothetical protein